MYVIVEALKYFGVVYYGLLNFILYKKLFWLKIMNIIVVIHIYSADLFKKKKKVFNYKFKEKKILIF